MNITFDDYITMATPDEKKRFDYISDFYLARELAHKYAQKHKLIITAYIGGSKGSLFTWESMPDKGKNG